MFVTKYCKLALFPTCYSSVLHAETLVLKQALEGEINRERRLKNIISEGDFKTSIQTIKNEIQIPISTIIKDI